MTGGGRALCLCCGAVSRRTAGRERRGPQAAVAFTRRGPVGGQFLDHFPQRADAVFQLRVPPGRVSVRRIRDFDVGIHAVVFHGPSTPPPNQVA